MKSRHGWEIDTISRTRLYIRLLKCSLLLLRIHLYFFSDWKKYTEPMDSQYMKYEDFTKLTKNIESFIENNFCIKSK